MSRKEDNEKNLVECMLDGIEKAEEGKIPYPVQFHLPDITAYFSLKNIENVIQSVNTQAVNHTCAITIFINEKSGKLDLNACVYPKPGERKIN